ncbi:hypothetical protein Sjap_021585 [Stephania japonica]|uniref:Kinesin motor domain-containing protein n=1 Tax=Stephania japonica TaxID=461633 RepID=A0AAP0HP52_9MAGN
MSMSRAQKSSPYVSATASATATASQFRSRKSPAPPPPSRTGGGGRPTTPSSSGSRSATPPSSSSGSRASAVAAPPRLSPELAKAKENVTVTVRFRPLSAREIDKGDEIAWYADGDYTVRSEFNSSTAYGFDRVFGPATTTRHVYDVAAQHAVSGVMEGINGTVFAYGVTSSGKTHTMHGEQKSPGIIPLAVKDVFGIIQETPGREFLLRVSYLEIYNEVINDLLDPTGQNLRIREDAQGTYVEGIKEEVVLSPAHAFSLIASGEGSESSKAETTGLRRKEGSYINKSLLTLGTVISKLTDGKSTHIPYRDSKLTRLLQSSLSGHGRVSLICTVTPASSNSEETHNTLKFAHRSKHVEIKASQNKILDEKSLIKKYQKEISSLKQELEQLRQGIVGKSYLGTSNQEDLVSLKLQLEAGQVKLQSRLEEEEQAKAALMGRIQRLTKLILVSTKNTISSTTHEKSGNKRRHSFGEDELAYLPDRKREYITDDDASIFGSEFSADGKCDLHNLDDFINDKKKNKKRGMLGWLKLRKQELLAGVSTSVDSDTSISGSPASSLQSSQCRVLSSEMKDGRRRSVNKRGDDVSLVDSFSERTQAGDLFIASLRGRRLPPLNELEQETGTTITDQMDLLCEQVKMLAGEEQMQKLKNDINEKKLQMRVLEQQIIGSIETTPHSPKNIEVSQVLSKLTAHLNEKTFELEIKSADNRVLQEQLQTKISENAEMQETILLLRQQLDSFLGQSSSPAGNYSSPKDRPLQDMDGWKGKTDMYEEAYIDGKTPKSAVNLNGVPSQEDSFGCKNHVLLNSQVLLQSKAGRGSLVCKELAAAAAVELRNLAEEVTKLSYENAKLKGDLAAAKESSHCRASCCQRYVFFNGKKDHSNGLRSKPEDGILLWELQRDLNARCESDTSLAAVLSERDQRESELQKRLEIAKQREEELENELSNMWVLVAKIRKAGISEETSHVGDDIDMYHMFPRRVPNGYLSANLHSNKMLTENQLENKEFPTLEELRIAHERDKRSCKKLESIISRLKGEDLVGMDLEALEELQNLHVEAITRIVHAKMSRIDVSHDLSLLMKDLNLF